MDVSPELEGLGASVLLDQGWRGNDPGAKAMCAAQSTVQSLGCSLDAEMMPGFTRHVFVQSRGWAVDVDLSTPGAAAGQNRRFSPASCGVPSFSLNHPGWQKSCTPIPGQPYTSQIQCAPQSGLSCPVP